MTQETKAGEPVAWRFFWKGLGESHQNSFTLGTPPQSSIDYANNPENGCRIQLAYLAPPDTEALRQQNAELLRMLTEQDYEYNRNTNNLIKRHTKQLATCQAENLRLREALDAVQQVANRSDGITGWHLNGDVASWDSILPEVYEALSTPPGDQSALREVIAQVLDERGQAQRFGNADYGADPYYLLIGNTAQLRSGEWTPEALK